MPFDPTDPIKSRQIGLMSGEKYAERQIFDDKVADRSEFKFDGTKGGTSWKSAIEFYMSSKVPILMELLKWAEKHGDTVVDSTNLAMCLSDVYALDGDRQEFLHTAIWGFLSSCVKGSALTIFKLAEVFCGLDAWRRQRLASPA